MRILAVNGEPGALRRLTTRFRDAGWAVDGARTVRAARSCLVDAPYDLVVLAVRVLADGDGMDLVEDLPDETGLVVVGQVGGTEERAQVLEAGADDCLDPPAGVDELVVRVAKVLVRRTSPSSAPVRLGRVVIDRVAREVRVDGEPVPLTVTQFCVLDHLVAFRHRVVSSGELLEHCWNSERDLLSDPLPSQINRLRVAFRGVLSFRWVDRGGYLVEAVEEGDDLDDLEDLGDLGDLDGVDGQLELEGLDGRDDLDDPEEQDPDGPDPGSGAAGKM